MWNQIASVVNQNLSPLSVVTSDDDFEFVICQVDQVPVHAHGEIKDMWRATVSQHEWHDADDRFIEVLDRKRSVRFNSFVEMVHGVSSIMDGNTNLAMWLHYSEALCLQILLEWDTLQDDGYDEIDSTSSIQDEDFDDVF